MNGVLVMLGRLLGYVACAPGAVECSLDRKRGWRPLNDLSRLGVFAIGELNDEATADLLGAYARCGLELADTGIRR